MIYRVALALLDKYGLAIAQMALILYLAWRFHSNHLKHINDELEKNSKKLDKLDENIGKLDSRISRIEGQLKKS